MECTSLFGGDGLCVCVWGGGGGDRNDRVTKCVIEEVRFL